MSFEQFYRLIADEDTRWFDILEHEKPQAIASSSS